MSTSAQIAANQQNALASTGPVTEAGKQISSRNATRHGFTGQQIVLSPAEKDAYETHCIAYLEQYQPRTQEETCLIQQYADQHWTLQQISVQQINLLSLMNAIQTQYLAAGTGFDEMTASMAPLYKQLSTLSTYEQRRRRAADAVLAQFNSLVEAREKSLAEAVQTCKALKASGQPFSPADFGFVHSLPEIESRLSRQTARANLQKASAERPTAQI